MSTETLAVVIFKEGFWLGAFFFFLLFLFWYFRILNGVVLSKFGRDLNQLFVKFLRKFLKFLVIVSLMLEVNFETWILNFSDSDFVFFFNSLV